jgi:hypothetical protein
MLGFSQTNGFAVDFLLQCRFGYVLGFAKVGEALIQAQKLLSVFLNQMKVMCD